MAGAVFHVEFGFNETPLTRALESGNYVQAEKIIRDTLNPSSLDEGMWPWGIQGFGLPWE